MDFFNPRTELLEHVFHHVIALDQNAILFDLARRVAVADMPDQPHQIAGDFVQVFIGGDTFDETPVDQIKRVAVVYRRRVFQINQQRFTLRGRDDFAAQEPFIIGQHAEANTAVPVARAPDCVTRKIRHQNMKYRCAIGRVSAGWQVSNSPSARTS